MREGVLVLADGSTFEGELFGADVPAAAGEVVFNTALSGYQEVLTDPSYAGQIVTFTNPHIGNYGVNATDFESRGLFCRGVVVRDLARRYSNRRAEDDLDSLLRAHGVAGITGIDTRRLTRLIRTTGALPGAFGPADQLDDLRAAALAEPGTDGVDLVATVTTAQPYTVPATGGSGRCPAPHRRLRLRHQADDRAPPHQTRDRRRRAGDDSGRRGAGPRARRHLLVQRAGRSGLRRRCRRHHRRVARLAGAGVRHLPRSPVAWRVRSAGRRSSCRSATTGPIIR